MSGVFVNCIRKRKGDDDLDPLEKQQYEDDTQPILLQKRQAQSPAVEKVEIVLMKKQGQFLWKKWRENQIGVARVRMADNCIAQNSS